MTYFGLTLFCFAAATFIPISSEAAFVSALTLKKDLAFVLIFATVGNCAGVAFNYWLGRKGEELLLHKHLEKKSFAKAYKIMQRWGNWSLIISWVPVLGDPITILAGVLKINFVLFVCISFSLRFLRYLFIANLLNL